MELRQRSALSHPRSWCLSFLLLSLNKPSQHHFHCLLCLQRVSGEQGGGGLLLCGFGSGETLWSTATLPADGGRRVCTIPQRSALWKGDSRSRVSVGHAEMSLKRNRIFTLSLTVSSVLYPLKLCVRTQSDRPDCRYTTNLKNVQRTTTLLCTSPYFFWLDFQSFYILHKCYLQRHYTNLLFHFQMIIEGWFETMVLQNGFNKSTEVSCDIKGIWY